MRMKKIFMIIAISTGLQVAVNAQELLNLRFHGTCSPGDPNQTGVSGKRNSTKMTDADLIAQSVGGGGLNQNLALVYNTGADSIQVIDNSDDSVVGDVFQFAGGTGVTNNEGVSRLVFVFIPGKTEAIGSAVITERSNNGNGRTRLIGRLQFTMPEGGLGGGTDATNGTSTETNTVSVVDTNAVIDVSNAVQVCTGTFTTSSRLGNPGSSAQAKLSKQAKRANKQANKQLKKTNKQSAQAASITNTTEASGTNSLSTTTTPGSISTGTTGTTGTTTTTVSTTTPGSITTGTTTTIGSTGTTGSTPITAVSTVPGSTTTGSTSTRTITPPAAVGGGTSQVVTTP